MLLQLEDMKMSIKRNVRPDSNGISARRSYLSGAYTHETSIMDDDAGR